jgi:hypothetical protein
MLNDSKDVYPTLGFSLFAATSLWMGALLGRKLNEPVFFKLAWVEEPSLDVYDASDLYMSPQLDLENVALPPDYAVRAA